MFKRPGRLVAVAVGVLALLGMAAIVHLALPPRQTSDVSVPPTNATPEQVVTAYLDALNAHDCGTAEAVMTPDAVEEAASWCHDLGSLKDVAVRHHFRESPRVSAMPKSVEVADVPVTFNLDWRPFHNDGSMDEGATTWGYLLVRKTPDAPWRIFDQGSG